LGIFADTTDAGGAGRQILKDWAVGVAPIKDDQKLTGNGVGSGIQGTAEMVELLDGTRTDTEKLGLAAVLGEGFRGSVASRFNWGGGMEKGDGDQAEAFGQGHHGGELQHALSANEVGVELGAEGIAAVGDTRDVGAGFGEQGVIQRDAQGRAGRQLIDDRAADDGKEVVDGDTVLGEDAIVGGPILKLHTGGGEQPGHGVAAEAEQGTQGEGLGALGEAELGEGGEGLLPECLEGGEDAGRVFFRAEAGGFSRRRANKLLSSTIHSTVSPRVNSMAWATAEGKLMYHCSLT